MASRVEADESTENMPRHCLSFVTAEMLDRVVVYAVAAGLAGVLSAGAALSRSTVSRIWGVIRDEFAV